MTLPPSTTPPEDRRPRPTRHRGPVVLRGGEPAGHAPGSTTDQRLLDKRGPTDWVHTDPWRVLRIQSEFVEGFGLLAELPRAVSVFGSARTPRDHPHYAAGVQIGAALAQAGYAVITGGGISNTLCSTPSMRKRTRPTSRRGSRWMSEARCS